MRLYRHEFGPGKGGRRPPGVMLSTERVRIALRPNFTGRRPYHDGTGLGEVIDESSDGRQHAPGRGEDQVDDAPLARSTAAGGWLLDTRCAVAGGR